VESVIVELMRVLRCWHEGATDLGGDDELVARSAGERGTEPALGQSQPVVRSGVEVANAARPRDIDGVDRLGVGGLAVEVAEGGGAEADLTQRGRSAQCGAANITTSSSRRFHRTI